MIRGWKKRHVFAALGIAMVGFAALMVGLVIWSESRVQARLNALRAAGEPTSVDELEQLASVPEGQTDLTQAWLAAIAPFDSKILPIPQDMNIDSGTPPPGEDWPQLAKAEELLTANAAKLEALHLAAEQSGGVYYPGLRQFMDIQQRLGHWNQARHAARWLQLEARVRAHRGDPSGAIDSVEAMLAAAESMDREPLIAGFLVRVAILGMTMEELQTLLESGTLPAENLREFQQELRKVDLQGGLTLATQGERVAGLHWYEHPPTGGGAIGRFAWQVQNGSLSDYLDGMTPIVDATELDWPEGLTKLETLAAAAANQTNIALWLQPISAVQSMTQAAAIITAKVRAADAAIAVVLYYQKHGQLPERLDELVPEFLPEVPADPFHDAPLNYRVENGEVVIYSVGLDRVDDGGRDVSTDDASRSGDFGFRLPLPDGSAE
ncbi:MAG: hypothetical protein WDZ59_16890 [Pirellulales bacterium]